MSIKRKIRFNMIRMLRQKQGAHQISLGLMLGFFPCWFPTFGIGPLLSISLAKFVKGNLPAAIIAASIGSFLWPILFFLNYSVGKMISTLLNRSKFFNTDEVHRYNLNNELTTSTSYFSKWNQIGFDFLLGFTVNSILFSFFGYLILNSFIKRYRFQILNFLKSKK